MNCLRRYPFKNAYNVRDLGGYPTQDGDITRFGVFYRADSLANLSSEEWQLLKQMQVKTIIDLRSTKERMSKTYEPCESIRYLHMPLQDEKKNSAILEQAISQYNSDKAFEISMSETYIELFRGNVDQIISIVKIIADSIEQGPVLFHCTAGKDRTGIIAALILYLCHVDLVDISADYQITYTYNLKNPIIQEVIQVYGNLLRSDPDSIEALIIYFDTQDIEHLLSSKGLSAHELRNIKDQFISR